MKGAGWIEVICGSMFSGKTESLIMRLRLAQIARKKVIIFVPKKDNRYGEGVIASHDARSLPGLVVETAGEILELSGEAQVVGVDESQFFGLDLVEVCEELANQGKRVIVAGLDQDWRGLPFEPMPSLLCVAESITKKLAVCVDCGRPANRSQRIVASKARIVVGEKDVYKARCRRCFERPKE